MAIIKEFSALRFGEVAGDIGSVCCPPYDIISNEEKEKFLQNNENNIIRLELPLQSPEGYREANRVFQKWLSVGVLKQDQTDAIYIYEERFAVKGKNYAFKGFVCYVKLAEFSENIVLPHEETLSKAKTDRFNLLNSTGCSFSQIYSLYNDEKGESSALINELSNRKSDISFTDNEGITHSLWILEKSDKTALLCSHFADRKLYIADGHHRYETALNYRRFVKENNLNVPNSEFVMMFLVNMENEGLVVFPTHRIVRDLALFDSNNLLEKCKKYFNVDKIALEDTENLLYREYLKGNVAFGYFDGLNSYLLTLKDITVMDSIFPNKSNYLRRLDVTVLHTLVLEELLGIDKENMANQINLTYTRSFDEAISSASKDANCTFILNPTRISEIAEVAAAGEKMPQKSTYFYPKLITGLVMNKLK